MTAVIAAAVISGFFGLLSALLVYRQTTAGNRATTALAESQQKLEERVVDREDFEALYDRLEAQLKQALQRITELEQRLETEVTARERAEQRADLAEERADAAEREVRRLKERVAHLEDELDTAKAALRIAVHDDEHERPGPHSPPEP